jgi:hypothetical protein
MASLEKAAETRLGLTAARGRIEPSLQFLLGEPRFQALLSRAEAKAAARTSAGLR